MKGTGNRWPYNLFENSLTEGGNTSNYDGEVCTTQLLKNYYILICLKKEIAFLIETLTAILALSNPTDCSRGIHCHTKLAELFTIKQKRRVPWCRGRVPRLMEPSYAFLHYDMARLTTSIPPPYRFATRYFGHPVWTVIP
ncbi:hypothetical protein NPIL_198761 [Nephila pilipes]|uniref:Uncharacterized protein n=1 Tax=Nephila pilipes TaxID=299642 RepID=A0A8X6R5D7_NEPPI|nr:hypothetical protein NPIL_198761 [Nephila pilipes]